MGSYGLSNFKRRYRKFPNGLLIAILPTEIHFPLLLTALPKTVVLCLTLLHVMQCQIYQSVMAFFLLVLIETALALYQPPSLDSLSTQNILEGNARISENRQTGPIEKTQLEATNFEIKATISKCPKQKTCDCDSTFQCAANDTRAINLRTNEHRSKCDQQADDEMLRSCEKKLSLTLKVKNRGLTNCQPQYIVLDHVFDPATNKKQKLLNPYVLKVTQKPVYQVYDLVFENVVNSGPQEKVLNKNNERFSGCSTDSTSATCGTLQYENQEVPYSTGFCCSCQSPRSSKDPTDIAGSLPLDDKLKHVDQKEISEMALANFDPAKPAENPLLGSDLSNAENLIGGRFNLPRIGRHLVKDKKEGHKSRLHRRGGQDCNDDYTPPNVDPETYHDSAHCMEFSDVWYSMYKIVHPEISHSLEIKIFEKVGMGGSRISWRRVSSTPIVLGTANPRYANLEGTILAYYSVNEQIDSEFALDCKSHFLLIPEVAGRNPQENQHPEASGGPSEYLVVRETDIDISGKSCNKAGVGFEAFARQPRRCDNDRGSCLQNQPRQMWQHDHDLETSGRKGCYFLKNYGLLPAEPVRSKPCNGSSKKTQNKLLYMYYLPPVTSNVNINFAADMNAILKPDALAMITEVYTETLNPKRVTVTVKILNSGLVTSVFFVGIGACPLEIPASFGSISSQPVLIAPQHQHIFTLEIYCELPLTNFYCSLEVFNMKQQLVAVRRIRFQKSDRCICVWYCQCVCFSADYVLKCTPMEIEQYHAAGFQGGMPITTQVVNYSFFDDSLSVMLHIVLYFCLTLWYMGVIKAAVGCCVLPIGLWGLDRILELPKKLNQYYEPELKQEKVIYDEEGWAIHPETGKKVNNVAPPTQFAINMVFFFIFPFAILWNLGKKLLAPKYAPHKRFSELDICKCKASQISLLKEFGLQESTKKKNQKNSSMERAVGLKANRARRARQRRNKASAGYFVAQKAKKPDLIVGFYIAFYLLVCLNKST
ncbi:uncharacterized protein LOC109537197 isoform X2 [Dendroctonus ponderosae]|uniref:uncharacterized protein LOC109537197 isoform X2 n=1 Tax=Dendroctonus ponderosae TaxID=77166 RepID=UPI002035039E|nr:uncharacterized protein LOC109537197 isoform X2 [Dendroctonus ponderosae]